MDVNANIVCAARQAIAVGRSVQLSQAAQRLDKKPSARMPHVSDQHRYEGLDTW